MLMVLPVLLPIIFPPLTLHEYVLPVTGVTLNVFVLYSQTLPGPLITGTGVGLTENVFVTVESQPEGFVWVMVTEPVPVAPHFTEIAFTLFAPIKVPPEAVHKYVLPPADGTQKTAVLYSQT